MKKIIIPGLIAAAGFGLYQVLKKTGVEMPFETNVHPHLGNRKRVETEEGPVYVYPVTKGNYIKGFNKIEDIAQCGLEIAVLRGEFKEVILPRTNKHHLKADAVIVDEEGMNHTRVIKRFDITPNSDVRHRRLTRKDLESWCERYGLSECPSTLRIRIYPDGTMDQVTMKPFLALDEVITVVKPHDNPEKVDVRISAWSQDLYGFEENIVL